MKPTRVRRAEHRGPRRGVCLADGVIEHPTQNSASLRAEARLQQINLSDQLAGCFVRELACPRHAVELSPFGAKADKPELPLDLVDLASQRRLFAGFGPAVDALAIEFHDANTGIAIKVGVAAAFTHVVLRPLNGLNRDFGRRDACQILFLLPRWLGGYVPGL